MDENLLYRKVGGLIKKHRINRKLTQSELAKRVGLSRGSIANIESGSQRILAHQLYIFSRHLEIKPADLLPEYREEEIENIINVNIEVGGTENHTIQKETGNKVLSWISEMVRRAAHEGT